MYDMQLCPTQITLPVPSMARFDVGPRPCSLSSAICPLFLLLQYYCFIIATLERKDYI